MRQGKQRGTAAADRFRRAEERRSTARTSRSRCRSVRRSRIKAVLKPLPLNQILSPVPSSLSLSSAPSVILVFESLLYNSLAHRRFQTSGHKILTERQRERDPPKTISQKTADLDSGVPSDFRWAGWRDSGIVTRETNESTDYEDAGFTDLSELNFRRFVVVSGFQPLCQPLCFNWPTLPAEEGGSDEMLGDSAWESEGKLDVGTR
ncbi:hypothetical protein H6P81_008582 [Aristolochia fimbriata]|uniref:Uncharacterized protein n=1 Tax=Aristolochia fimbriata TaxID=158543 RepID=A0AAV7EM03_ARIFI|nr:hypothetical protein H6P81_008582 [Aristolochia fimbriata]